MSVLDEMDRDLSGDTQGALESAAARFGLRKTSGTRSSSRNRAVGGAPNSYHLTGQADDFVGPTTAMQQFHNYIRMGYGDKIAEAIHGSGDHKDHVHVAWKKPVASQMDKELGGSVIDEMDRDLSSVASPAATGAVAGTQTAGPSSQAAPPSFSEQAFKKWYGERAKQLRLNPNPDDPRHHYDYRAAYRAGAEPGPDGHWDSRFKAPDHPNRFVNGIDTITGQPVTPPSAELSKVSLGIETAFNERKAAGDIEGAKRYGALLKNEGWEVGESDGWPYVKPPSGQHRPAGQGTEKFAADARQQAPPRVHRPFRIPGVGTIPAPIAEGVVDVAAGASAPIVRAAQGVARLPGRAADELRRMPSIPGVHTASPQPAGPQIRASYESNPVEQGLGKAATTVEEFAAEHGLDVGVAKELATAAGGLGPLLLLKNPAAIGGFTAAETYGRGETLPTALKSGAEQAAVIGTMGMGARGLDEAIAGAGVPRAAARLAGRTAVNVGAPNLIRAATGQDVHPITPGEAVMGAGFALAHGVTEPKAREPRARLVPPNEPVDGTALRAQGLTHTKTNAGTFVHDPSLTHAEVRAATREGRQGELLAPRPPHHSAFQPRTEEGKFDAEPSVVEQMDRELAPSRGPAMIPRDAAEEALTAQRLAVGPPEEPMARRAPRLINPASVEELRKASLPEPIERSADVSRGTTLVEDINAATRRYDDTGDITFDDLVNEIDRIASDSDHPAAAKLLSAVEGYRDAARVDREQFGMRGDMDAEEEGFMRAVRTALPTTIEEPSSVGAEMDRDLAPKKPSRADLYDKLAASRRPEQEPLLQESKLTSDELDRVRAKFESLKKEAGGRPLKTVVDDYLKQGSMFGEQLSLDQQNALRAMASPQRRAPVKTEQGGLFAGGIKPTVESRIAEQEARPQPGVTGGLFGAREETALEPRKAKAAEPIARQVTLDDGRTVEVQGSGHATYWRDPADKSPYGSSFTLASPQFRAKIEAGKPTGESQRIGIFDKSGTLRGTASLSMKDDPREWVDREYGKQFDYGPLTMEAEPKQIEAGKPEFGKLFQRDDESHALITSVIDDLASEGVKDFREAVARFRDEFGPAEQYSAQFERAWDANPNVKKRGKLSFDDAMEGRDKPLVERERISAGPKDTPLLKAVRARGGIDPKGAEGSDINQYFSRREGGYGLMRKGGKGVDELVRSLREEDGFPFRQEDDPLYDPVGELSDAMMQEASGKPFRRMGDEQDVDVDKGWAEYSRQEFAEKSDHSVMSKAFAKSDSPEYKPFVEGYDRLHEPNPEAEDFSYFSESAADLGISSETINRLIATANRHRETQAKRADRAQGSVSGEGTTVPRNAADLKQALVDKFNYTSEQADATTAVADALFSTLAKESGQSKESFYRRMGVGSGGTGKGLEQGAKLTKKWSIDSDETNDIYDVYNAKGKIVFSGEERDADRYIEEGWRPGDRDYGRQPPQVAASASKPVKENPAAINAIAKAKKHFGTTPDIAEAGYILPNGQMLDFSGRHQVDAKQRGPWLSAQRSVDHREIQDVVSKSGFRAMVQFVNYGAVRVHRASDGTLMLTFSKPLTESQMSALSRYAEHGVILEVWDKNGEGLYDARTTDRISAMRAIRAGNDVASGKEPPALFQGPRGMTSFLKTGQAVIRALQNPNESTAVHEIHHALAPEFMKLADSPDVSDRFRADMGHMSRWMGFKDASEFNALHDQYTASTLKGRDLKRYIDGQEKAARGFEKYLRTGKAPTPALEAAFSKFREWLSAIYQNLKGSAIDIGIGAKQTAVWDRMLGGKGGEVRTTGIKNAETNFEREARGLNPIEKEARKSLGQSLDEGKGLVDDDPAFRARVRQWANQPHNLTDAEVGALTYDRMRLHNEKQRLEDQISKALGDEDTSTELTLRAQLENVQEDLNNNDYASDRGGTQTARALSARRMMVRQDYSLERMMTRARNANDGKELSAAMKTKIEEQYGQIVDLESQLNARDKIIAEQQMQLMREEKVENWSKATRRKGARAPAMIDAELGKLETAFAKMTGHEGALLQADKLDDIFTPEMRQIIKSIARNRVEAGARTAEAVNAEVHRIVSKYLPGVEPREVGDVWSEYGKSAKLSKEEIDVAMREAKRQRRLLSALEDAQAGETPLRSGLNRDKPTERVRELTKQVSAEMRKMGIADTRSPEQRWATALESIKTNLRNSITDMTKRLETGEKPAKRVSTPLDAEAKNLKAQRDALAQTLRDIEGPRKLTEQERIQMSERGLEKSIANLDERIKAGQLSPKSRTVSPWSPKVSELHAQRDALAGQLKALRDAAKPARDVDAERIKASERALVKSIEKLDERIKTNDLAAHSPTSAAWSPEISRLQAERKVRADILSDLRKAAKPPRDKDAEQLKAFKKRVEKSTVEYQRRLDEGDFTTTKRLTLEERGKLDPESRDLMIERDKVKRQYQLELARMRPGRWRREILSALNLPRAVLASFDLSAPLRQGAILTLPPTQWKAASKAGFDMFRSLSHKGYDRFRLDLEHQALMPKAKTAKLHLSSLVDGELASLVQREEAFMSRFADKIPGVSHSQNAYVAYLDSLRFQTFKKFADSMPHASEKDLADVAKFINYATGRGDLGKLGNAVAPALNAVFFAPRYLASRVQIMNPVTYAKMSPAARKMAAKNLIQFTGVLGTALGLAAASGAQVGLNPDDPDFLKIKVGNTRYDALAGFQQLARLGWGMAKGFYNNARGIQNERGHGPSEIAGRFLRTKLSPPAGFITDLAVGTTFKGDKMSEELTSPGKMAYERLTPILTRDMYEAWKDAEAQGRPGWTGVVKASPTIFGVGVQTYEKKAKTGSSGPTGPRPPKPAGPPKPAR